MADGNSPATEEKEGLIGSYMTITSSSREEAELSLQYHRWDLNTAVITFIDNTRVSNVPNPSAEQLLPSSPNLGLDDPVRSHSPSDDSAGFFSAAPSLSPRGLRFRSRSPSPPNAARYTRRPNRAADNPSENNGGGDQSGAMVQHHPEDADVEGPPRSTDTSLRDINDAPLNSSDDGIDALVRKYLQMPDSPSELSQPDSDTMVFTITVWRNGYTINDGPFEKLDDPANAEFREYLQKPDYARALCRPDWSTIRVKVIRREEEDFPEPPDSVPAEPPATSVSQEVDPAAPTTWIIIRLVDGTRITSEFNTHHTIEDIRSFIDNSRPGGSTDYELLSMGFPPTPLPNSDQTIEDAGIPKSVLIQKLR